MEVRTITSIVRFPHYKNDMQVQKEQDSILATYQPYFHIEKNAEKR